MLRKPGPRVRFAHFWPFSCSHCGTRPEHSPQSLRFCIPLRVSAFGLTGSWDGHCRGSSCFFGLTGLHGSHCWACRGYFGLVRLGWRSWARAVVGAVLAAPVAFRMGDRAIIPAKVASNLQPHHKHTFTSRLRDAWGRGFLWRSSAVKREGHLAYACLHAKAWWPSRFGTRTV